MATVNTQFAHLDDEQLQKLKEVEQKLGGPVVIAYDQPLASAHLSQEQLETLRKAEEEIGVCLVAYQKAA